MKKATALQVIILCLFTFSKTLMANDLNKQYKLLKSDVHSILNEKKQPIILSNIFTKEYREQGYAIIKLNFSSTIIKHSYNSEKNITYLKLINTKLSDNFNSNIVYDTKTNIINKVQSTETPEGVVVAIYTKDKHKALIRKDNNTLNVHISALKSISVTSNPQYTGKKLSFNFQDIKVRSALQIIAEFTGLNIVVTDSVKGTMSLKLDKVPWDQALDIILKAKGLAQRKHGNVLMIAPTNEVNAREKMELEASQHILDLEPLESEFIRINYAKASTLALLLKDKSNSLLSTRGSVNLDDRTNTLLVQDTARKIHEIKNIVAVLDEPVKQVQIEARMVQATDSFSKAIGIRWGVSHSALFKNYSVGTSGDLDSANSQAQSGTNAASPSARLNQSFPVTLDNASKFAFSLGTLGNAPFLDLELQASQTEGLSKVIASPKITTANQKEASIKQGKEIPYEESSSSGATSVAFRDAVLELRVTPQITPDDNIIMDLIIKQDSVDEATASTLATGQKPIINTQEIATQVLVSNGETIVLGGVFSKDESDSTLKIPVLGDLPLIGNLFRRKEKSNKRDELLIFVTPHIIYNNQA